MQRQLVLISLFLVLTNTLQAFGASKHEEALAIVNDAVTDFSKSGPQDASCPHSGMETLEIGKIEGRLPSARDSITKIQQLTETEAKMILGKSNKCGTCKQNNVMTTINVTRPMTDKKVQACENLKTEVIRSEFTDHQNMEAFVQAVLDGKNQEGQRIYAACPNPCSFYVYSASTVLPNGQLRSNLYVQCGQPRSGLLGKYTFSGAVTQEWTCSK